MTKEEQRKELEHSRMWRDCSLFRFYGDYGECIHKDNKESICNAYYCPLIKKEN